MKYTEVTFDPLGRIRLPSGSAVNFDWNGFDKMAEPIPPSKKWRPKEALQVAADGIIGFHGLPLRVASRLPTGEIRIVNAGGEAGRIVNIAKRKQRGGVKKGKIWAHVAAEQVHWGLQFNNGAGHPTRYNWFRAALFTIRQHSRNPATRAEAQRLLTVLETRNV